MIRLLTLLGVLVVLLSPLGCGGPDRYIPPTIGSDPPIEALIADFEDAMNAEDEARVCALYLSPSRRCGQVWRQRLASLSLPVNLVFRGTTPDCAGGDRVTLAPGAGIGGVSVVVDERVSGILDVGFGNRRSSLTLPRYRDCADWNFSEGSVVDPACDAADANSFSDLEPPCPDRREQESGEFPIAGPTPDH